MKIKTDDTGDTSRLDLNQARAARETSAPNSSDSTSIRSASANDSIALSNSNDLVQQALAAGADVRAARVQELRNLVASGQYSVDAVKVSRALIQAHLAGD